MGVWVLSLVISSPPLVGWNDWPDHFDRDTPCQLTSNQGYVVYSSLGSFFIPLIIMTIVYIEIYVATRRRLRERAQASKINAMALKSNITVKTAELATKNSGSDERERESISSELNHNDQAGISDGSLNSKDMKRKKKKDKKKMAKDSIKDLKDKHHVHVPLSDENSVTDVHEHDDSKPSDETTNAVIEIEKSKGDVKFTENSNLNNNNNVANKKCGVVYQFIEEKQKISLSKERRAARTLGIIMGNYVALRNSQCTNKRQR